LLPHSPGAATDLADNKELGQILTDFIKEKSMTILFAAINSK
jgi:hypothetical protein